MRRAARRAPQPARRAPQPPLQVRTRLMKGI
jgi:hypothetical protein